jgi:prolyl-tRNA synthetase
VICPVNYRQSEQVRQVAEHLHAQLQSSGIEVLLDDRGERPGSMFADWELIGVPHRITIGERGLKGGGIEYAHRRDLQAVAVPLADAPEFISRQVAAGRS